MGNKRTSVLTIRFNSDCLSTFLNIDVKDKSKIKNIIKEYVIRVHNRIKQQYISYLELETFFKILREDLPQCFSKKDLKLDIAIPSEIKNELFGIISKFIKENGLESKISTTGILRALILIEIATDVEDEIDKYSILIGKIDDLMVLILDKFSKIEKLIEECCNKTNNNIADKQHYKKRFWKSRKVVPEFPINDYLMLIGNKG